MLETGPGTIFRFEVAIIKNSTDDTTVITIHNEEFVNDKSYPATSHMNIRFNVKLL